MLDSHQLFNMKFDEFLEDLVSTYPEEDELKAMKNMLDLSIKCMGSNVPQEMFNSCVAVPFGTRILTKDESFFLEECPYDQRYADINIINKLKSKWKGLSSENKEVVWKYMKVLLVLNYRCGGQEIKQYK